MKTYQPSVKEVKRNWHTLDASEKVVGRLATEIVNLLMGKQKPTYSAHIDSGDFVVVINCEKVILTGKKEDQKVYYRHSGFPGGFREIAVSKLRAENPTRILELAVRRMLPDNRLRDDRMGRLKLVVGSENPYAKTK